MRAEKQFVNNEYIARLNASPFFIVANYQGLAVKHFNELRKRLGKAGAQIHVVKNSIFRLAAKEAGAGDLGGGLNGQLAVVTGQKDISAAAKVMKSFQAEFEKPKIQFGYLGKERLELKQVQAIAELPSLEVLRAQLLGLFNLPATRLAQVIKAPGQQLAQVLKARLDKGE
jgi:large subunit ribosomal protein L10